MLLRYLSYPLIALFLIVSSANQKCLAAQERTFESMANRLLACSACHGIYGEGNNQNPYFPRLSGQPTGYLKNQLQAFRDGNRRYHPMNYLTTYLSDKYLQEIAIYFSKFRPILYSSNIPNVLSSELELGQKLVKEGELTSRKVLACVICHGENLTGRYPDIPSLVGLSKEYISAQLGAFRTGVRNDAQSGHMKEIAIQLSDEEVAAVSNWISIQPIPKNFLSGTAKKVPFTCRNY